MESGTAVCISDHVRDPMLTIGSLRRHVLEPLRADVLLYLPRPPASDSDNHTLVRGLNPVAMESEPRDLTRADFEAMLQPHTAQYHAAILSAGIAGALGPLGCGHIRTSSMSVTCTNARCCSKTLHTYYGQARCLALLERAERSRGRPYGWVLYTRGELLWQAHHPPTRANLYFL